MQLHDRLTEGTWVSNKTVLYCSPKYSHSNAQARRNRLAVMIQTMTDRGISAATLDV